MRVHVLTLIYDGDDAIHAQFAATSMTVLGWKLDEWIVKRNLECDDDLPRFAYPKGSNIRQALVTWVQANYACCTAEVHTHHIAG